MSMAVYKPIHKALLVISVKQEKVNGLSEEAKIKQAGAMATALRGLPGVRQVEAIVSRGWREEGKLVETSSAPWAPVGAFVVVEAPDPGALQARIDTIWNEAGQFDQRGLELFGVDDW